MIRVLHVYVPKRLLLLVVSEAALMVLALVSTAYALFGPDAELMLAYEGGLYKIVLVAAISLCCMHYYDLYEANVIYSAAEVLTRLIQVLGTVVLILALVYYLYPAAQLGRRMVVAWVVLAGVLLALWRGLFCKLNSSSRLRHRAVLLGTGPLAAEIAREVHTHRELGILLDGFVAQEGDKPEVEGIRCLGGIEDLPDLAMNGQYRHIIVTLQERRGRMPVEMLLQLKAHGVRVQDGADVYEAVTGKVPLDSLRLGWLLFSPGFKVSRWTLFYKRISSLLISSAALLIAFPLMIVIALVIRLESAGPVIFRQQRVGLDGKIFTLFKLRTMVSGSNPDQPARIHDRRCTRIGRWLRLLHLDELPQFYNVLRGDMHFVGPRPFTPMLESEYREKIPFYSQRWVVRPGITGWAQIHRGYCETVEDNKEKLSYDLFYIKNMSMGLDMVILLETIKVLLLGRGSR